MDETEYKERVIQLVELKPDFISAFHHLSFPEFLGLLKVIAHPNFFDFLNTLPPQTTFAELNLLLITELDSIPPDIKVALSELKHYQSNREKIAEDSRQSLLTLKEKFMISGDTLKTELARLAPKPQTTLALETISPQNISEANAPETPWLTYGAILIGFAVTISLNILFFSVNLLLTSIVLISLFSYPIVRTYALSPVTSKSVPNPDQKKAPLPEKPAEPILVRIIKPTVSAPERVNIAQIDSVASPINDETFGSAAYKIYGLFNQPKETDDPTSFSDETHDLMSRRR